MSDRVNTPGWNQPGAFKTDNVRFRLGSEKEIGDLARLHYAHHYSTFSDAVYVGLIGDDIVAGAILSSPVSELGEWVEKSKVLGWISDNIFTIKRIVVHPSFQKHGIARRLVEYACNEHPHHLIDIRSSLFRGTTVLERWGGRSLARPYRELTPEHESLALWLQEKNLGLEVLDFTGVKKIPRDLLLDASVMKLVLNRLEEIDYHQWLYIESLVKEVGVFTDSECRDAQKVYADYWRSEYSKQNIVDLLPLCRKWDSEAFIMSVKHYD